MGEVKIRFGVSPGPSTGVGDLPRIIDRLESAGVDSLCFSELVYTPAVDPFAGMAYAPGRTTRLKAGTSVAVLPWRNPVLMAKQRASLAALRRIGRLADGWLGSFLTAAEARAARETIERAAAEAGRAIEPGHYGLSVAVADGVVPDEVTATWTG